MASIEITELHPIGSELFQDSESFLNELSDQETWGVQGGATMGTLASLLGDLLGQTFGNSGFNITGPDSVQSLINLQQLLVLGGRSA